jgi:hypothetical protein
MTSPTVIKQRVARARRASTGDYRAAREIAREWHGGSDHNITGLSHGREWNSFGLVEEIEGNIATQSRLGDIEGKQNVAELDALKTWALRHTDITSVWSAHGHRFTEHDGYSRCSLCGAEFELVHTSGSNVHVGRYRGLRGKDASECSGPEVSHEDNDDCNCHLHG